MEKIKINIASPEEKKIPSNLEAEQALIGSVLENNDIIDEISNIVNSHKFFDPAHKKIYEVIETLNNKGMIANPITLKNFFEKDNMLNEVGGTEYLVKLTRFSGSTKQSIDYAKIIHEMYLRRELVLISSQLSSDTLNATSQEQNAENIIENTEKSLFDLGAGPGYALYWFEELGFKVNGIEPAPQYVKKINEKLKIGKCINGFAEDMNVDGKFDVVWISGVLHRTFRPDIVLQKVREILNDDGFVYINVPNIENPTYRKLGPKQNTNSFHFTKKTLSKLLKSTGFKTEKIDCFRSLKKHEGGINRVWSRYLKLEKNKLYPYYPQKLVDETEGTRIRGIFTKE